MILDAVFTKVSREFRIPNGPPLIIIGMHRSGTSMVTRILRQAGGYFGYRLDPNSEAIISLRLNHSFLSYANASWDFFPRGFRTEDLSRNFKVVLCLLSNKNLLWSHFFEFFGRADAEERLLRRHEYQLPLLSVTEILNFRNQTHTMVNDAVPFWGWKDPRTTLTLSVWLKIFPDAKVVHVVRSGIDVALSLWRRCHECGEGAPRCLSLPYCFSLWGRYVEEGCKWRSLGEDRYIEVRYEDLLCDPIEGLKPLLSFIGVAPENALVLSKLVRSDRMARGSLKCVEEVVERAKGSKVFRDLGSDK